MDTKDAIINLYGNVIDTNKSMLELGRACSRSLKRQNGINRNMCVNIFLTAVSVTMLWVYVLEQDKTIAKLSNEIKELKSEKGE